MLGLEPREFQVAPCMLSAGGVVSFVAHPQLLGLLLVRKNHQDLFF